MLSGTVLLIVALVLSGLSGYMSVIGMAALFPGGGYVIMAMMAALEVTKLVIAGWLHSNWTKKGLSLLHKSYLLSAVLVLMTLTSVGIFGNLSKDHLEQEAPVAGAEIKIAQIQQRISQTQTDRKRLDDRQAQLDAQINTILGVSKSTKDVAKSQKIQTTQKKERDQLRSDMATKDAEINKLSDTLVPLKLQISDVSAKLGPIKYVANLFGWTDTEKAVDMIILMIMFAFDPLAVVSVLSAVFSFEEWSDKRRSAKEAKNLREGPKAPATVDASEVEVLPTSSVAVEMPIVKPSKDEESTVTSSSIIDMEWRDIVSPANSEPTVDPGIFTPVIESVDVPIVAPAPFPTDLQVTVSPSAYVNSYGSVQPLHAEIVNWQPISINQDPTFLSSYTQPASEPTLAPVTPPQTDREKLLELLAAHPDVLEQVVKIVEEDNGVIHAASTPLPTTTAAPQSLFPAPESEKKPEPSGWMSEPWFPGK